MRYALLVTSCALGLLPSCAGLFAQPAVVTVRVIDARNGKPYKGLSLRIDLLKAMQTPQGFSNKARARTNLIATRLERTDDRGEVKLDLPTPLPGVISVFSGPMACGPGYFDTQVVTKQGAVGENHCKTRWGKSGVNVQAKPGEIIYFATHVGFVEGGLTK